MFSRMLLLVLVGCTLMHTTLAQPGMPAPPSPAPHPPPRCRWSPGINGTGNSFAVKYPLGKAISPAACMMICDMELANNQSCLGITYDNTMPAPANPCSIIEKTGGTPTTNNKMMMMYKCDTSPRCRWTAGKMGTGNSFAVKYPLGTAISLDACMMVCEMELVNNQSCLGITYDHTIPAPAKPCWVIEKKGGEATSNNKMMMVHTCSLCKMCADGTYASQPCTAKTDTVCAGCDATCKTCNGAGPKKCLSCKPQKTLQKDYSCNAPMPCVAGTNFSTTGMMPCNACTKCAAGKKVSKPCTAKTDTVCAAASG